MKKGILKDAAEVIGMAAIVISLGLVAYEVRQNTRAIEQEAAATYTANSIASNFFVAGNSDFSRIIVKSWSEELSAEEKLRLSVFFRGVTQSWQNTYFQYLSGTLDEIFWQSEFTFMGAIIRSNSGTWRAYWKAEQHFFTEEFGELVIGIMQEQ